MEIKGKIQEVSIESLSANIWNPNIQTDFIFDKELTSIKNHGFIDPILVREKEGRLEIIDGEHRYKAAKTLGIKKVSINNLGKISDENAKQLTILMNEVRGKADKTKMGELLKDLQTSLPFEDLVLNLPYSDIEIQSMIGQVSLDWDQIASDVTSKASESDEQKEGWKKIEIRVPIEIHDAFKDQLSRFKKLLFPNDSTKNVSDVQPIEAMIQVLAQTPDNHII